MWSIWGKAMSAAKRPRPVTNGPSSRRRTDRPTTLISRPSFWRAGAQCRPDALRRRGKLVDRYAEGRHGVIDGVDYGGRRTDSTTLAESLRLGKGGLRQGLQVMYLDRGNLARRRWQIVGERGSQHVP